MNSNIRIARQLVRMARELVAGHENFGFYNIEFDDAKRTFTVYFLLKDDAVESEALKNAESCRYEIKTVLEKNPLVEVTNVENNQRSFCFTIVIEQKDADKSANGRKSSFGGASRMMVAVGDLDEPADEGKSDDSDSDVGKGDEGGDDNLDFTDEKDGKKNGLDREDQQMMEDIRKEVSRICKKYNWNTKK